MRGVQVKIICVCVYLLASVDLLQADISMSEIYLIEAGDCACVPDLRILTGFRLEGLNGIVTSLHGVVGCNHVTARQALTGEAIIGLKPTLFDIEHDVVVLTSSELKGTHGLPRHPTGQPETSNVTVFGHPQAMPSLWKMSLELESLSPKRLSGILGSLLNVARDRRSPSVDALVFRINGNLQPGHSGAPIVDSDGRVLGVASGGLAGGTLGIGWAVPLNEIDWVDKNDEHWEENWGPELERLKGMKPTALFAHKDPGRQFKHTIWSQGDGNIPQTGSFDLDRGDSHPTREEADLFFNAKTRVERYLIPRGRSVMVRMGSLGFEEVTLGTLERAKYSREGVNASRDERNALPPGTVLAVRTSQGRYSKILIKKSSGDRITFKWITYARPGEGKSPLPPSVDSDDPFRVEGQMEGDAIFSFSILSINDNELRISVRHNYNQAHSDVFLGARLLDKDGSSLADGFYPTAASKSGETQMRVLRGSGRSQYLRVWMYESYKSIPFVVGHFEYILY